MGNKSRKRVGRQDYQMARREPYYLRATPARIAVANSHATGPLLSGTISSPSTTTTADPGTPAQTTAASTDLAAGASLTQAAVPTAIARVFGVAELFDMIMAKLDLTSMNAMITVDRQSFDHIANGINSRKIRFLAPMPERPREFLLNNRLQTVTEVPHKTISQDSATEGHVLKVYEINAVLGRIDDEFGDGDLDFDKLEAMQGQTDIDLPYLAYDDWEHVDIRQLQITKPAISEIHFNYAPADTDAEKVHLEISNKDGVMIGHIIDAVKARGDAGKEKSLRSRLWHRDIVLLHKSELETLEEMARGSRTTVEEEDSNASTF